LQAQREGVKVSIFQMDANALFAAALQLSPPWKVVNSEFDKEEGELSIWVDFQAGSRFACPRCGELCSVYDTMQKQWRHLNFWQYQTVLSARMPRIQCPKDGVLLFEGAPWARPGSGFSLMMEAFILLLCKQMPVSEAAEMIGEEDTRLWRVLIHYIEQAQSERDWSQVNRILVDETSARRGHRYVTVVLDEETHQLLLMVEGRTAAALEEFACALREHGGDPQRIEWIGMDMSPAFIKGAKASFPQAQIVFDRFHIMQMAGIAVDTVRKDLQRAGAELKQQRWAILGNEWTRNDQQREARRDLCNRYPRLGRAIGLRDMLQDILEDKNEADLKWWLQRAGRSRLEPFKKLARTIREHWDGILGFFRSGITSAAIEAVNGCIQLAKRLARGFRSFRYFRCMAYLKAGRLDIKTPSLTPT
jgi:transposase